MYFGLFGMHLLFVISWVVFLLLLIKSIQNDTKDKVIFTLLSLFFMVAVLGVGTKMMLLNPNVAKVGIWLHVKLSFDILLMIENLVLAFVVFKKKTISSKALEIMFWLSYLVFMFMVYLSVFKPM
ncbi:hypothetical protein [Caminibacter pacificus]|uniref:Membrane protein n=1 Tax=Caminibacter pacificus TaxID=1424653 RepID=A0AAJ4REA9_9BACT|nr:hypothetical protein [Caminibacter pacificus]NPA87990.1 hypothetical protein [Campylobacterota bacterium]QCI28060.1 hypothetical protein C6V80_03545 [Caminibacter pacificus]ROR41232.1 putative membrane protein [Caminibacter pacificus]